MTIKQHGGVFGRNPEFSTVSLPDNGKAVFGSSNDLEIYHSGSASYITDQGTGNLFIQGADLVLKGPSGNFFYGASGGNAYMYYAGSSKLETTPAGVTITGNVKVNDGNGIDFSATAGAGTSELLDDYEEGTWTPVIAGSSAAGTYEISIAQADYVKIGKSVTVNFRIVMAGSLTGGGSGNLEITGLPFLKAENIIAQGSVVTRGIDLTSGAISLSCGFGTTSAVSKVVLEETIDNATSVIVPITALAANDTIQATITYTSTT